MWIKKPNEKNLKIFVTYMQLRIDKHVFRAEIRKGGWEDTKVSECD